MCATFARQRSVNQQLFVRQVERELERLAVEAAARSEGDVQQAAVLSPSLYVFVRVCARSLSLSLSRSLSILLSISISSSFSLSCSLSLSDQSHNE